MEKEQERRIKVDGKQIELRKLGKVIGEFIRKVQ
jgi:hypothetical protein